MELHNHVTLFFKTVPVQHLFHCFDKLAAEHAEMNQVGQKNNGAAHSQVDMPFQTKLC